MAAGSDRSDWWIVLAFAIVIAIPVAIIFVRRHGVRRPAIFVAGWLVIFLGILMLPSPCPGAPVVVLAGLALLATEFHWARAPLHRIRERIDRFRGR